MKKNLKLFLFGILIWVVPFVVSFAFYGPNGELTVSYDLFKSMMIVISSLAGCYALSQYFKVVEENYLREGILAGIAWLFINWLLDLVVLVPFAKMTYSAYFESIGIRYLQIPVICIAFGLRLSAKMTQSKN